ncbi:hypothetical protein RDI58_006201 [Solanum bulbocastanum]|uniref:Secreted protein n=1 Tax=Solanum bulbocastanum TaxID=147425 RepID=A0AAN8U0D3_SOLBU
MMLLIISFQTARLVQYCGISGNIQLYNYQQYEMQKQKTGPVIHCHYKVKARTCLRLEHIWNMRRTTCITQSKKEHK